MAAGPVEVAAWAWPDPISLVTKTGISPMSVWKQPALRLPVVPPAPYSEKNPNRFFAVFGASMAPGVRGCPETAC
jgi:hypothetical protein